MSYHNPNTFVYQLVIFRAVDWELGMGIIYNSEKFLGKATDPGSACITIISVQKLYFLYNCFLNLDMKKFS